MLHRIPVLKLLHIPRAQRRHFRTISGVGLEPLFGSNTSQPPTPATISLQPRSSFARVRCGRVPGGIAVAARASRLMRRQIPSCHSCTYHLSAPIIGCSSCRSCASHVSHVCNCLWINWQLLSAHQPTARCGIAMCEAVWRHLPG